MIKLEHKYIVYSGFGKIYNIWIALTDKVGKFKIIEREVYHRPDAVGVLLYNRDKDTVILTNQMRPGPLYNDHDRKNCYEIVAGLCDQNEMSKVEIAKMEALQEVGYKLNNISEIMTFYSSPGSSTERLTLFYAEVTDSDKIAEGGGCEDENEVIEILEVDFEDVIATCGIDDAKTIIVLQWLKLRKLTFDHFNY